VSAVAGIVSAWNASPIPEIAEVTATVGVDSLGVEDGTIVLTADTAGKPFVISYLIGSGGNEIQTVTLGNSPTGGTFTLTYSGQTTGNIAYDADAATVDAALEALSNIGAGDVTVTGSAGGPWTVEFTGSLAGTDVALLTGDPTNLLGTDEQQIISLGTATGGTFTLTFGGQTTGNIAYNADAATVETALEALSTVGSGNVSVAGSAGGPWTVTFENTLGKTDVAFITVDGTNLTGKLSVSISETTDGVPGAENEVHLYHAVGTSGVDGVFTITGDASATAGTFTLGLTVGGAAVFTTDAIAYDATLTEIQAAIDAKAASSLKYNAGEIHIIGEAAGTTLVDGATISVRISCAITGNGVVVPTVTNSLTGGTYSAVAVTSVTNSSESSQAGSFYITYGAYTTDDIDINASESTVQSALEALANIGSGNVSVSQTFGTGLADSGTYVVEFIGALSNQNVGLTPVIGTNSGTSYTLSAAKAWSGIAGTNEVQQISISGSPGAGTFALEYAGEQTALLDYNATASEVEAALEALSTVGTGNVSCTGGVLPGTPVDVEFIGALGAASLALIVAPGGSSAESVKGGSAPTVTITTIQTPVSKASTTASSGPNDWNVAANWSANTVPVSSDTVYIGDTDSSILYGLDQSAVTLAALHIEQTFSGFIGLPRTNSDGAPYTEYRDQYLQIGATTLFIGDKEGDGSDRIKINLGSVQSTVLITDSGDGEDANTPAILLLGTHASNVININRGSLGVAYFPTEVSTIATLRQAFFDDAADDTTVYLGAGVTITDIIKRVVCSISTQPRPHSSRLPDRPRFTPGHMRCSTFCPGC